MPKQLVHHRRSAQRAALALSQFRLRPHWDSDRAAERRGGRDDAGAGWRSGTGGYCGCCVWESGGEGTADLEGEGTLVWFLVWGIEGEIARTMSQFGPVVVVARAQPPQSVYEVSVW